MDQKSRGFHLRKPHLADPTRLARLLMAAGLAYIWIVYLGALCAHDGWISIIHVGDRCAGHRLAEWLCSQGHDVLEAPDLGPDPGDRALLERAAAEGRIQDLDLEDRLRIEQV